MRTGGVDPSRMGRKKKSPKPRPKRPKSKPQENLSATIQETENISSSREDVSGGQDVSSYGALSEGQDPPSVPDGLEYVNAPRERLATTPASPGEGGVIDISQQFQVVTTSIYITCTKDTVFGIFEIYITKDTVFGLFERNNL